MAEIILSISQAVILICLLYFFFQREKEQLGYKRQLEDKVVSFPKDLKDSLMEVVKEVNTHALDMSSQNFAAYLKHIKELEKLTLPRPITTADVEAVIQRGAQAVENDIAKNDEDLGGDLEDNPFGQVPISNNTKIAFDGMGELGGDDMPTTIE